MQIPDIKYVENLLLVGKYKIALDIIVAHDLSSYEISDRIKWGILHGKCLSKMGQYQQAIDILIHLNTTFPTSLSLQTTELRIELIVALADALLRHGDTSRGYEYIENLKKLQLENVSGYHLGIIHKLTAMYHWFIGDLDLAFQSATLALPYFQQSSNGAYEIAFILNLQGICLMRLGDLQGAEPKFAESYAEFMLLGDQQSAAIALANHGSTLLQKGELDAALPKLEDAQSIFKEQQSLRHYADTLRSIGQLYQRKDMIIKALGYVNESLHLRMGLGNELEIAESLFWLIILHLDNDDIGAAELQFALLKKLHHKHVNPLLQLRYNLARAMLHKAVGRIHDLAIAQSILKKILSNEVKDHELTVLSLINYLELLVIELKITNTSAIESDIATTISRLIDIANLQDSPLLLSEIHWLQAKIAYLQFNINAAKDYFTKAQKIAEKWNLTKLAVKISNDYDTFLDETSTNSSNNLKSRSSEIERLSEEIKYRKELYDVELGEEEPIKLMLLAPESGITYYSYDFAPNVHAYDTLLMGNFIQAIQGFSSAMFSREIDRMKIGEYNLMISMPPYAMICYIYKGASYLSEKKLRKFMNALESEPALTSKITELFKKGIYLTPDQLMLDPKVEAIFLN